MKHNPCLKKKLKKSRESKSKGAIQKEIFQKGIFKRSFLFAIPLILSFSSQLFARDLSSGVKEIESQLSTIMYIAGPVAFMVAAAMFYFSRQLGMDRLFAAVIGTVVFMASKTLFVFFERAFH